MAGPVTYGEAVGLPYPDVLMRWQQLAVRATSDLEDDRLTVAEFLELLSLGEVMARRLRHPSIVERALEAGATWPQVADATGCTTREALAAYASWVVGQEVPGS